MVVLHVDFVGVAVLEPERDPEVCCNFDAPGSFSIALQFMKLPAGHFHSIRSRGRIKLVELTSNAFSHFLWDALGSADLKKSL